MEEKKKGYLYNVKNWFFSNAFLSFLTLCICFRFAVPLSVFQAVAYSAPLPNEKGRSSNVFLDTDHSGVWWIQEISSTLVRGVKSKQSFLAALKRLSSAETDLPLHRVNDLKHWEGGSWEAESFSLISSYIMCTPEEQVSVRPEFFWRVIAKNGQAHWKWPHFLSPQWYYLTYCIMIQ